MSVISRYNFSLIETKWQKKWEDEKTYISKINKKKNFIA